MSIIDRINELKITIYNVDVPDNIDSDGFRFNNFDKFLVFMKENNINYCFVNTVFSSSDEYIITDDMLEEYVDENSSSLYGKIKTKVKEYNKKVSKINFSIPSQIFIVVIFQGQKFYYHKLEEFIIDGQDIQEPEDKLEEILHYFEEEVIEEKNKIKELIKLQIEKLKEVIRNDDQFKLCTNKHLRRNYIIDLFKNRLNSDYKELKTYWTNSETPAYVYRGAIDLVEMIWNEMKRQK